MIKLDFRNDWKEFLEQDLAGYDLQYDPLKSLGGNTVRYLNARRRTVCNIARSIYESRELCIPNQHRGDYSRLKRVMRGGDLKPFLSRDIGKKRADKNDPLLNAWGIQHLHFKSQGSRSRWCRSASVRG
jgi:hypothetical protein